MLKIILERRNEIKNGKIYVKMLKDNGRITEQEGKGV